MLKEVRQDRRQFGRRQTSCHGWVRVRGRPAVSCIVRDVSKGGAQLDFTSVPSLPPRFHLTIEAEGIDTECVVRHQAANIVGVEFVGVM